MNLKTLSDEALHINTLALARRERKLTVEVLHHLREIERRLLHAKRGNSSLVEYCVRELGYTKSAGQRRVDSMRVLKIVPEVEAKIVDGSLSITHLSDAQRTLMSLTDQPEAHIPERVRVVSSELTEVRIVVDQQTLTQLEELKALLSHAMPGMGVKEALMYGLELALAKHRVKAPKETKAKVVELGPPASEQKSLVPAPVPNAGRASASKSRPAIPVEVRRFVLHRDGGQCTYSNSGRRCGSRSYLDLDHVIPVAQGGANTPENLRVRCRTHNQLGAVEVFGARTMARYLLSIRSDWS